MFYGSLSFWYIYIFQTYFFLALFLIFSPLFRSSHEFFTLEPTSFSPSRDLVGAWRRCSTIANHVLSHQCSTVETLVESQSVETGRSVGPARLLEPHPASQWKIAIQQAVTKSRWNKNASKNMNQLHKGHTKKKTMNASRSRNAPIHHRPTPTRTNKRSALSLAFCSTEYVCVCVSCMTAIKGWKIMKIRLVEAKRVYVENQ